jgi:hypothetical protein
LGFLFGGGLDDVTDFLTRGIHGFKLKGRHKPFPVLVERRRRGRRPA